MSEPDDKDIDPALEAIRSKLIRFFVFNAVFLLAAVMVVIGAIVYKGMSKPKTVVAVPAVPSEPSTAPLAIPAGARLNAVSASADRIVLDLTLADGTREIRVHDAASGALAGRHALVTE